MEGLIWLLVLISTQRFSLSGRVNSSVQRNSDGQQQLLISSTISSSSAEDSADFTWPSAASLPCAPVNLTVMAKLAEPSATQWSFSQPIDSFTSKKRLKLRITWEKAQGTVVEGYNVQVRALPAKSASDDVTLCTQHFTDYFVHVTWQDPGVIELGSPVNEDSLILYGCTYSVMVQSTPFFPDREQSAVVNYTVPDCVENVCFCAAVAKLVKPTILSLEQIGTLVTNRPRTYEIAWSFSNTDKNVTHNMTAFIVRVEKLEHLGFGQIYRKVRDYRHLYSKEVANYSRVLHNIDQFFEYRIRLFAVDSHHCEGESSTVRITAVTMGGGYLKQDGYTPTETMIVILLPCIALAIICPLCVVFVWRKSIRRLVHLSMNGIFRCTTDRSTHGDRYFNNPAYLNLSCRRNFMAGTPRQGQHVVNVLYVDKEIEESKTSETAADDYEISVHRLKIDTQIGKGAYGRVFLATAEGLKNQTRPVLVAVKQMKKKARPDEADDFLSEISMMKHVGRHPNIVVMLACVTVHQPYLMVLEYVPYGDLLQYLRRLRDIYKKQEGASSSSAVDPKDRGHKKREGGLVRVFHSYERKTASVPTESGHSRLLASSCNQSTNSSNSCCSGYSQSSYVLANPSKDAETCHSSKDAHLDIDELQDFALQISRGMEHLELKNITHRDLAARNILVSEGLVLKISDFGLSRRGIYVNTRTRMLPLRWLAVESMRDNLYSNKSDVWAFGIVLWEICTLGGFPYPTISDGNLLNSLLKGERLQKPDNASDELYEMMVSCWNDDPDKRPSFNQLHSSLENLEDGRKKYVDFKSNSGLYVLPPTEEEATAPAVRMKESHAGSVTNHAVL